MKKMLFSFGQTVATRSVFSWMINDSKFCQELSIAVQRHASGDWGDLCEEDKKTNDIALHKNGRLFSEYDTSQGKIWIITELYRSVTTILFPYEY